MKEKCSICGDTEPFHVHNGDKRIDDYFTVGRDMTDFEAAKEWQRKYVELKKQIGRALAEIRPKLDSIEEHMAWIIRADKRFRVGQRVELSRKARRSHIVPKTRLDCKGTVKRIGDAFGILVKLDGYRHPRSFHHSFFNPVSGPKLF